MSASTSPQGQGAEAALDDEDVSDAADLHENPYPENSLGWEKWNEGYAGMVEAIKEQPFFKS